MTILMEEVIQMDEVLARYVVRPMRPQLPVEDPQHAEVMEEYAQRLKDDVVGRVARFPRFAAGLGRNVNLLQSEMKLFNETIRSAHAERIAAYQNAAQTLLTEKLPAEEQKARLNDLAREHDLAGMNAELQVRRNEQLKEPSTIKEWYRMPLTYLPGWNDPEDAPEAQRRGVVDPLDIAFLERVGVLYTPDEAEKKTP